MIMTAPMAGAATLVSFGDFDNPMSEDFEALPSGAIQENNPVFAVLGITGITGAGRRDRFNSRAGTGLSLGLTSSGALSLFNPGSRGYSFRSVAFSFSAPTLQFGLSFSDQNFRNNAVTFRLGGSIVDTFLLSTTNRAGLNTFFFETATAFDNVSLDLDGAYIDAIHVGNLAPVPLPAGLPLLLAGIGGLGLVARRKCTRQK